MAVEKISAKLSNQEDNEAVTVEYDFGDNLQDAAEKYGEDVVFQRFRSAATVDLQSLIRRGIKAGKDAATIQQEASEWAPGVRKTTKKSAEERIKEQFSKLSQEEREALMAELTG